MTLVPQTMIRVLAPLMKAAEFPLNLAAIKMLTKLVDCCGRDPVVKYLPDLMPGLIQVILLLFGLLFIIYNKMVKISLLHQSYFDKYKS